MPHSEFFPSVSRTLLHLGNRVDRVSIEDICPRNLADVCSEAAFRLVVLLEMRARKLRHKPDSDIWNRWAEKTATAREGDQLNEQIINTWLLFLDEYRTPTEIEQVLWTSFLVSDDSARRVRVVDLLNAECPSHLICHDVVVLSLTNLWKNGPSCRAVDSTAQIGLRYDALCTPRALHFIDLATHLAYFGLLVSYVMHPPSEPTISRTMLEYIGAREILLMVFSSSILIRPWTLFSVPFAMTLSIFLFSIPVVPFAADLSFNFLLLAFVFHTFQLHLSHSPSPLYLLKVDHSLPFVHFIAKGFRRIILPLVLFFVPISILGTSWLSLALADTFFTSPSFIALLPTPMQTRTTVLFMFFALVAAICCSLFIFVVQGLHLDTDASGWDAYSPAVGLAARASFVRTVISYSSPYLFPAPFSLLQALLITVPSFVFRRLGFQTFFARAERILWRTIVGPVGLVCALVVALFP
ncbi:hypothetical protein DFH08DRAFT_690510 [Mycena albidolilacea]|uniref:Uncharacterized protein n=1 Tax=Mycena albidolilacea TaxID=1033008 RepID=A0AAD7ADF5_9AGAR|nr:hypothetical protein DFH08DRAFT_690510 [Mycena albidolilacea]